MKKEQINASGKLNDDHITEADRVHNRKRLKRSMLLGIAAAACVCLIALLALYMFRQGGGPGLLSASALQIGAPTYPEMSTYPSEERFITESGDFDSDAHNAAWDSWWADRQNQLQQPEGYTDGLREFFARTAPRFLAQSGDENGVYSPLNLYMALGMLSELTDGESRSQLLSLLSSGSIEEQRAKAAAIWNSSYCDDGAVKSILANSLWLDDGIGYNEETIGTLADSYYASSHQGAMGSGEYNNMLREWVNDQTGGLLQEQAGSLELDSDTLLALASTVYFQAKWRDEFDEAETESAVFHAPTGDITCDFMHQSSDRAYCWSDRFSAVSQYLEGSGSMHLILPDEGVSPGELLEDPALTDYLFSPESWQNSEYIKVNLALPKFDVASNTDLTEGLQALGVTDVFDAGISDFSPTITGTDGIFLSQAEHAARVVIDEKGCTAAAYTVMAMSGSGAPPEDEIDFVLDRPFLFVITGANGLPLFIGTVNRPVA